mmetsp:Transcript_31652/g.79402  ORF Transcript_31652/g.79402 Transcript_31652/m.79402 type:complete len:289 (-) Transcript_31652:931-1797(-)
MNNFLQWATTPSSSADASREITTLRRRACTCGSPSLGVQPSTANILENSRRTIAHIFACSGVDSHTSANLARLEEMFVHTVSSVSFSYASTMVSACDVGACPLRESANASFTMASRSMTGTDRSLIPSVRLASVAASYLMRQNAVRWLLGSDQSVSLMPGIAMSADRSFKDTACTLVDPSGYRNATAMGMFHTGLVLGVFPEDRKRVWWHDSASPVRFTVTRGYPVVFVQCSMSATTSSPDTSDSAFHRSMVVALPYWWRTRYLRMPSWNLSSPRKLATMRMMQAPFS